MLRDEATACARLILSHTGLTSSIPTPLRPICQSLCLAAKVLPMEHDCTWHQCDDLRIITVNRRIPPDARRCILAREIGRAVLGPLSKDSLDSALDAFASELLLPGETFYRAALSRTPLELAEMYRVPAEWIDRQLRARETCPSSGSGLVAKFF